MNRIAEILESGRAPGFRTGAADPTSADVAVPKAIKDCFEPSWRHKRGLRDQDVFKAIGYSEKTIRNTWPALK